MIFTRPKNIKPFWVFRFDLVDYLEHVRASWDDATVLALASRLWTKLLDVKKTYEFVCTDMKWKLRFRQSVYHQVNFRRFLTPQNEADVRDMLDAIRG